MRSFRFSSWSAAVLPHMLEQQHNETVLRLGSWQIFGMTLSASGSAISDLLLKQAVIVCSARLHPIVHFFLVKFPKPTDFVARHLPFANPFVDRIPLDAEIVSNLIYGEPSVFHYSTPLMFGLFFCLATGLFLLVDINVPYSSLLAYVPINLADRIMIYQPQVHCQSVCPIILLI